MKTKRRQYIEIEIEITNTKKGRKRKNKNQKKIRTTRGYADFRRFSARGGVQQTPKDMQCSNSPYKPDQLQQMVTSKHTCVIRTPNPFLGRAITVIYRSLLQAKKSHAHRLLLKFTTTTASTPIALLATLNIKVRTALI